MHNTDGVNPYTAEIAALLADRGAAVTLVDARNGEHRPPPTVRWRRVLPANFGGESAPRQLVALVVGLLTSVSSSLWRRHVLVVTYTRFPVEDFAFATLSALGRPVVVVLHNPEPRVAESALRRRARAAMLRRAATVVVHAERLRQDVGPDVAPRVAVCPHPPYLHSAPRPDAPATPGVTLPDRRWVAFVGTLRWDKGSDLLVEVLSLVPAPERARLGLVVCGRGNLPPGDWERLAALGIETRDLTSPDPVPQAQLLEVLAERPLVLAPYVAATQSGTVILALTTGCRVLAFDQGGIPDVLAPEGLVPTGDLQAFADALAAGRGGDGVLGLDEWAAVTGDAWWEALRAAEGHRHS